MLSILIPVYNYNVVQLVNELHQQGKNAFIDFEILVMEDGSTLFLEENKNVSKLSKCKYSVLEKNIGRAAIRNKLADEAVYEHLLFLDCDASIPNSNYLNKYLSFCKEDTVVLGGRIYEKSNDPKYSLLRKYGVRRERNDFNNEVSRKKHPMFTTPNFLIPKKIFNQVRFDENIVGYGHEDSIFGIRLRRLGIEYVFIDNPVIHTGLETNEVFIKKTRQSIQNLYKLYQSHQFDELEQDSKLIKTFLKLKKSGLNRIAFFNPISKLLEIQLKSGNPSLFFFDLYKILYLCHLDRQK